jgi:hypothetical protein
MEYLLAFASALGTIVSIVLWVRESLGSKPRTLIYPFLVLILTAVSVWEFRDNHIRNSIRAEAGDLVATWPKVDELTFRTKGERIGIYLSGLAFLEKYKQEFPNTYAAAAEIKRNRLSDFRAPASSDANYAEYDLMEDAAGAMIQLVKSIAK